MKDGSNYKEYLAGLMAGVSTVITGHPFDTVKVSPFPLSCFWILSVTLSFCLTSIYSYSNCIHFKACDLGEWAVFIFV